MVDGPDGATLRSAGAPAAAPAEAAPARRVTALTVVEGWPDDALRWLDSVLGHEADVDMEALLVVNSEDADLRARLAPRAGERVRLLLLEATGWAEAANAGLRAARGAVAVLFDPGTELQGPVLEALCGALDDSTVAVAGAFGVRGRGGVKEFDPHPGPDVDAVEGYCLALRREEALAAGGFDPRFRFYRIADFELSFRLRAQGRRRAVVIAGLPVLRHAHRVWEATPPEERERLSKRNFYRFLDRWRDRADLLTG